MTVPLWYSRLADIPGVMESELRPVKRTRLPGHNTHPRPLSHTWDGEVHESLWWDYAGVSTSASPASRHVTEQKPDESAREHLMRQLAEKLELPGTVSDYHFAIQNTLSELWRLRIDEPGALETLEALCGLNIRLLEACPEPLRLGPDQSYPFLLAFEYLAKILEREGYLLEALEVARRARPFGKLGGVEEALSARIAAMEAEL